MSNPAEQLGNIPEVGEFSLALSEARFKLGRAVMRGQLDVTNAYVAGYVNKAKLEHFLAGYKLVDRYSYRKAVYGLADSVEIAVPILNHNVRKPVLAVGDTYDYFQVRGLYEGKERELTVTEETYDELTNDETLPTFHILHKLIDYSPLPVEISES